ncbi:hypothetical protein [Salinibacterium sp. NK8237]|uniref:hypothetical protein n=1 Tax=Salinibacterium sp. NK8237 TaxID=2792038 RepID=UPI0018CE499C|nr:hypothetical protein [Salinibacterium sp. NK8237]MBH0129561.1 hypothetical protein [Salinibacterium sp. NK8237]
MNDWPTSAQIENFVESTKVLPDARLAVLSGLRRWAEPASSQLMVSLASVIVSIIGIAIAIAAILTASDRAAFVVVVILGVLYLLLALAGFAVALNMDVRRRMAHVWLRAIEDELNAQPRQDGFSFSRCVRRIFGTNARS